MAIANETIDQRPQSVEFAYGRAFYAVNSTVYFSQVIEQQNLSFLARCFQNNDPTSSEISDLVDTDGGVLPIDDASTILSLKAFYNGLLILATNGVWLLRGGEGGFTATSQTLTKLTASGCIAQGSVVSAEGDVYYWASEGIIKVGLSPEGFPFATNISEDQIDDFYEDIPSVLILRTTSNYDPAEKEISWFYGDDDSGMLDVKNKGLVYSLRTEGFFPDSYIYNVEEDVPEDFLVGKVTAYTPKTGNKTILITARPEIDALNTRIRAGVGYESEDFKDFKENYPVCFFETFNETLDQPSHVKKITDFTTQMVATEENWILGEDGLELDNPSSCLLSTKWEWNESDANGKWGPQQEIYRRRRLLIPNGEGPYDNGEEFVVYKPKVRGRGRALRFRFEQSPDKDMKILGWTVTWSMKARH